MATTKKKPTTKKTSVTKKTTVKSAKGPKRAAPLTWRFYVVAIGIFLVAVTTAVVMAYLTASVVTQRNNQARLDRISTIYSSLNVDERYNQVRTNVFGDKRVYDADKSRSESSSIQYIRGDTVSNTVADLDAKIKAAGFTFIDEPYPGSVNVQYHYKSSEGEYVRLSVSSKPYNDAWRNAAAMNQGTPANLDTIDKNAGPSEVTIKVNLDDNNE
jgi:Alphaherpesvirus glycoprotein E.